MAKRIVIAVTNDLVTDQRIYRVSSTLLKKGYDIQLVGRVLPNSTELKSACQVKRFKLLFNKGALFYANYNARLFFHLLFTKFDIVLANDLDTLPAAYFATKIRRKKIVYDSHEYFTEVPELLGRSFQQNSWRRIEKHIVPKLKYAYTVCQSIADIYNGLYGTVFRVVRNLPLAKDLQDSDKDDTKRVVIYQGALNLGRGIELMIQSMHHTNDCVLWIAGAGDVEHDLKQMVIDSKLSDKVKFLGRIPLKELHIITSKASIGLSLEENIGLNYYYALPNKLFDYIQAQIPVIVSNLPEMRRVVDQYSIGEILLDRTAEALAEKINDMLSNQEKLVNWRNKLKEASRDLIWEKESEKLLAIFEEVVYCKK